MKNYLKMLRLFFRKKLLTLGVASFMISTFFMLMLLDTLPSDDDIYRVKLSGSNKKSQRNRSNLWLLRHFRQLYQTENQITLAAETRREKLPLYNKSRENMLPRKKNLIMQAVIPENAERDQRDTGKEEGTTQQRNDFLGKENGSEPGGAEWKPPPNAGENGTAVVIDKSKLSKEQAEKLKNGRRLHSFNEYVSSLISLHRTVPDPRDPECRTQQYGPDLPDTSVVIIFFNEAWSTLLRTVHSVLDKSPPHLLKQIILVDDKSTLDHLGQQLDDYMSKVDKVTVLRSPTREGLIAARLLGLSYVTAKTVVFLDSHCECAEGWLEPLLDRIAKNSTTVVTPVIDVIDDNTFEFHFLSAKMTNVGTFTWGLTFTWMGIQPTEVLRRKSDIEPIRSPTMAGGLFAIDVAYFYKLGTYDPGLKVWGGENLELSFKIWMCGGTLETVPCSHVGHVFRRSSPITSGGFRNYVSINAARVAAVWLDEYSYYISSAQRAQRGELHIGDISQRLELRRRLQCHSFGWYLKHVLPERFMPSDRIAHGQIRHNSSNLCLYGLERQVVLKECKIRTMMRSTWNMDPGVGAIFLDINEHKKSCLDFAGKNLETYPCHGKGGNQIWNYKKDTKQLQHKVSGKCVTLSSGSAVPVMSSCQPDDANQQWDWNTSPVDGPSWRKDEAAGKRVL